MTERRLERGEKKEAVSVFCDAHGYIAESIPQQDVLPMVEAHREKMGCIYDIHIDLAVEEKEG
jgi:hypothetical protein